MKKADIILQRGTFLVSGDLDCANVMSVFNKCVSEFSNCKELNFDFSGVKSSDSSGIALIIEWVKLARAHKMKIHFHHLPKDLLSIAQVAGIDGLITQST